MIAEIKIRIQKRVAIFFHPFFIFLFLLLPLPSFSSFDFNQKLEDAYSEFLKLKVKKGQQLVEEVLKEDPTNGIAIYLANYGDVISVFISEEQVLYDRLRKNEDVRIKKISSLSKASPYYLFTQAEIKMQWAFVRLKFGDEVSAVYHVRQAYKLLESNQKLFPDFVPNNKTMGLLNVMIGSIPDKYSSLVNLTGMSGDIKKGIEQLTLVAESSTPYRLEAQILKILAENYIIKKDPVSFSAIRHICSSNPDNLLTNFLYASLLLKNAQSDESLELLRSRPSGIEYISFPYLDFLTGEIYLFKNHYKLAREHYEKFLDTYKGKNFIKDAYYKIFLTYYLANEEETAKTFIDKILKNGQTVYDTDKYAHKFAEKGEMPEKTLMKSRLAFDGGYYVRALEIIQSFTIKGPHSEKEIIEYYYRKGRIYHLLNNYSQASLFYLKTIELSPKSNLYFAPNSALQMGYIYKEQNNKELAKIYFQKALSYQNYEYKNSIDNKAKAALNEMKK